LYDIKEKHEKVLQFTTESQTQFEKQKEAQSSFDDLKAWEAKETSFPQGYSILSEEEKIQIQASLDSWHINCLFTQYLIKETSKSYSDLWDLALDIIKDYEMPHVQFLGQFVPLSDFLGDVHQQISFKNRWDHPTKFLEHG
jgi:hypothetical protein